MTNLKKLPSAIKFALFASAVTLVSGNAIAQEADTDKDAKTLDRIEVTGSRIKRAEIEGAQPVTVISRTDIEASGKVSVAELLQDTTFNSFGSFVPSSGSSAQSFSELSLRGLGGGRTLILIDGRRAPISPQTGEGQDLNTIPLAAVERVEILTDGASAIYGADALGGVVNIITRKDFNGVQVSMGTGDSERGGDTEEGSALFGISGDRGRILGGVSYSNRGLSYWRDFPWVQQGSSTYSNNYYSVATNEETGEQVPNSNLGAVPGGCTGENFRLGSNGTCYYDFTATGAQSASIDQKGLFARGDYQINDEWSVYFTSNVTQVDSLGVYAPTPEYIFVSADSPNNTTGEDAYIKHRFAAAGNRNNYDDTTTYDFTLGFNWQFNEKVAFDFGLRRNESKYTSIGYNYINIPVAEALFESGEYNAFDPSANSEEVLNQIRTTTSRDGYFKQDELYALATVDLFEMSGGTSVLAIGGEHRQEDYADIYDQQSAAGNVGGSSGNSSWGSRTLSSIYGEWNLPIISSLEANVAVRYDSYSDFGDSTSPKVSLRYHPIDSLTFRASYGEGFRAPSLAIINQQDAFSADSVSDPATCASLGLPGNCTVQINGLRVATPDLQPETSKQFSLGVVWDAADWLNLTLDYYNIEIENQIKFYSAQTVIDRTEAGEYLPSHLYVTRNADDSIQEVRAGYGNEGLVKTDGLDFAARARFDLGSWGSLRNELQVSWVNSYAVSNLDGSETEYVGSQGYPEWRASLRNTWDKGDFSLSWTINAIAYEPAYYVDYYEGVYSCSDLVDWGYADRCSGAYITHDLQASYRMPWNGKVAIGVKNLTNKDPVFDAAYTEGFNSYLYNPYGRQIYFRYTQTF